VRRILKRVLIVRAVRASIRLRPQVCRVARGATELERHAMVFLIVLRIPIAVAVARIRQLLALERVCECDRRANASGIAAPADGGAKRLLRHGRAERAGRQTRVGQVMIRMMRTHQQCKTAKRG